MPDVDAAGLGSQHELLLTQGKDLAADQAGNAGPAQEAQNQHQVHHTGPGVHAHGVHGSADDDNDGHRGDAVEHVDHTHDDVIDPAAEVAGDAAHQDTQGGFDDNDDEADDQRDAAAVHQAGQHVHAVGVGAQPVLLAGAGVTVVDVGLGHLLDAPHLGGRIVDDVVLGLVAVGIGVVELLGIIIDGFLQALLEVAGDDDAGIGGGDDEAADIAQCLAAGGDVAVLVQGVVHAVGGELFLAIGHSGQGAKLGLEVKLIRAVSLVDQVTAGVPHNSIALVNNVEIVVHQVEGVVHIFIGELGLAFFGGFQRLALGDRAEVLAVSHDKAHGVVAGHAHILFGHMGVGEELLVLAVGADKAADEGEQEHGHQNGQTDDSQTVAEEPLGDECARGQNLDAAVIVQGVLLLLRVLVLRIFAHGCAVSFL